MEAVALSEVFGPEVAKRISVSSYRVHVPERSLIRHEPYPGWSTRKQCLIWATLERAEFRRWLNGNGAKLGATVNPQWSAQSLDNNPFAGSYDPTKPTSRETEGVPSELLPPSGVMDLVANPFLADREYVRTYSGSEFTLTDYPILYYKQSTSIEDPRIFVLARIDPADAGRIDLLIDFYR